MASASRPEQPSLCGARIKTGTGVCRHERGWGTDHPGSGNCKFHGGRSPGGEISALKERARLAAPTATTPTEAIQRSLDGFNGVVDQLESELERMEGESVIENGELRAAVRLLQTALRDLALMGKLAADAGIAERQTRVAEQFVGDVAAAIDVILGEFGLRDDPRAPDAVRRALVVLEGGKPKELAA